MWSTLSFALRAIAVAVLLCIASPASAAAPVIPPGHEEAVQHMLEAPAGCALAGISIDRDRIEAVYDCDGEQVSVSLYHPYPAPDGAARVGDFAVVAEGSWPRSARAELFERIATRAPRDLWVVPSQRAPAGESRGGDSWPVGRSLLVLALLLAAIGGALRRVRQPQLPADSVRGSWPIAAIAMIGATVGLAVAVTEFRFAYDDFTKLLLAEVAPFAPDAEIRLIGLRAPFALALELGGDPVVFAAINAGATVAWFFLMSALLRRAGLARWPAAAAAAIGACSSYQLGLVRWGVGIQHIVVWVFVLAAILAVDDASRQRDPVRRTGALALSAAAALAAVLSKYPVAVVVPVLTYAWCRFVIDTPSPWLRKPWAHLGLAAIVGVPIAIARATLTSAEPAVAEMGLGAVPGNVVELLGRGQAIGVLALAWVAARAATGRLRSRPSPPAIAMVAMAVVALGPFMLNGAYFADYYPAGAYAWLAAAAVVDLAPGIGAVRGAVGKAVVVACAVAVWPWHGVGAMYRESPDNRVEAFLQAAREELAVIEQQPDVLVVSTVCDGADRPLDELMMAAGGGDGLRWITGWRDAHVVREWDGEGDEQVVFLGWCPEYRPRFSVRSRQRDQDQGY